LTHPKCSPSKQFTTRLAVGAMVMGSCSLERLDIGDENIEATTKGAAMFLVEIDDATKLIRERTK
jgi:hypothetical protein